METMTASEASIWKSERIGCGKVVSSKKNAPIPREKRGSLAAAEEMVRRGMRKARSLENLETLTKSLENLEMSKKSSPDRMFTDEGMKAWSKYLRMIRVQTKEASAPSVGEDEALAQEGLAEKTIDHHYPSSILAVGMFDTTVMMEKNDSRALLAKSDNSSALRRVEEDGRGTIFGVLIVDLIGMGGKSKAEAARRVVEAALADEATMDRLRAELRHEDEIQRKQAEPEEEDLEMKRTDYEAWMAREYRRRWISMYSGYFGSFDDTTRLGPMCFTDESAPDYSAHHMDTLQVFSVKVAGIKRSLQWPVDVFGVIAARDCIDHNRNIIFSRTRDRCQTLTAEIMSPLRLS